MEVLVRLRGADLKCDAGLRVERHLWEEVGVRQVAQLHVGSHVKGQPVTSTKPGQSSSPVLNPASADGRKVYLEWNLRRRRSFCIEFCLTKGQIGKTCEILQINKHK